MKTYVFTVEGNHVFPVDMLRYDRCYPTDGDSALAISHRPGPGERVSVSLRSPSPPTGGRWASFGWQIVRQSTEGR